MYDLRFKTPFTCIVAGQSSSGKTFLVNEILKHKHALFTEPPERTFMFYQEWQPIYDAMLDNKCVHEFHQGMPSIEELRNMILPFKKTGSCCIFDDSIHNIQNEISKLFSTYSHHLNCSVFFITQNLFLQNKEYRTMSLNANYCIIMGGIRSMSQVNTFARQISPYKTSYIVEGFRHATKNKPYSYLLLDFKQTTPDHLRVRTNILPHEQPMIIYLEKK